MLYIYIYKLKTAIFMNIYILNRYFLIYYVTLFFSFTVFYFFIKKILIFPVCERGGYPRALDGVGRVLLIRNPNGSGRGEMSRVRVFLGVHRGGFCSIPNHMELRALFKILMLYVLSPNSAIGI